jgi:hypothetical protein
MNHTFTDKYLTTAILNSLTRRAVMIGEADGETLESEAEDAFRVFLYEMRKQVNKRDEKKITMTLHEVFLAGYRASEERRFR